MSHRNMEVVPGMHAPVLGSALLTCTRELNQDYVELLLAQHVQPAGTVAQSLSTRLLDALAGLDEAARCSLAGCSYTLFSLGFDDRRFWSSMLSPARIESRAPIATRYAASGAPSVQSAFCEVALCSAWHTAHANRIAAGLVFGMPEPVALELMSTPLWRVRRVAIDYAGLVMPRWPLNPAFWPDLIRFAGNGERARLDAVRLLGSQLIAAELNESTPRVRCRSRHQVQRAPALT